MKEKIRISQGDWEALIDTAHGANCICLRNQKHNASLLREPPEDGILDNPYLYGMPILFPVNRIENGTFSFEGRKYVFPINEPATGCHLHGELHRMPFEILEQSPEKILCRYRAEKGEYLGFAHAFEILQEYELKSDGFYHTVTVRNLSAQNMPLFLGFHTTFNALFTSESRPEDIRVFAHVTEEYERNMEINYLPTGRKPEFDEISAALASGTFQPHSTKISRHYKGNGAMSVTDLKNGLRVVYESDEKFGFRLIFGGGEEGYVCLEPQTCLANCQNSPFPRSENGFDFIAPHKSKIYRTRIYTEKVK